MKPVFSVIIPVYNKQAYIKAMLESCLSQSFSNFEVIIVNDGSTDGSLEVIKQFVDDRIRLYTTENQGISKARNFAISVAAGELIAFLDADDVWMPNHLEDLYSLYKSFPEAGLFCTKYLIKSKKVTTKPVFNGLPEDDNWKGIVKDYFASSYRYRVAWVSAVAVPKYVLNKTGSFDETIEGAGEDLDLWVRIALHYPVALTNRISAVYFINESSITKVRTHKKKYTNLEKFKNYEKDSPSLKKFLDLYRIEFALQHKIDANHQTFKKYLKEVDKENLHWKTRILFSLPSGILKMLLKLKSLTKAFGVDFSVYH